MAKKKGKGKGVKSEPKIQAFDLENISKDELKKYVVFLEKELAAMRKDRAFYSLNKDTIMEFLKIRQDVLMLQKQDKVVRNAERFDLEERLKNYPGEINERSLVKDQDKVHQQEQKLFQDFVVRNSAGADHLQKEQYLQKQIADKDKLLEYDLFQCDITLIDLKETYQKAQDSLDLKYREKLEEMLQQYISKCCRVNKDFNAEKLKSLISVWDMKAYTHQTEIKESYIGEMRRMQDFFNEISTNNSEAIKMLRSTLTKLQVENKKIKFHVKKIMLENVELRVAQSSPIWSLSSAKASARVSQNMEMIFSEKKLEKLQFRNDVLTEKLRMLKEDLQDLKNQFVSATRKIHQKAEYKAFLIEEIIRLTLHMESVDSEDDKTSSESAESRPRGIKRDKKRMVNVFKLSVENSDTLFVPPLYHEFWDPSLKRQLH